MDPLDSIDEPLVIGDDFDIERTVTGIPEGDSLAEAWFTLKERDTDSDARAVLQKHINLTLQQGIGQITEAGEEGEGALVFQLTAAETVTLRDHRYVYDIQVKTANGKLYTRERGMVRPKMQVTRAT